MHVGGYLVSLGNGEEAMDTQPAPSVLDSSSDHSTPLPSKSLGYDASKLKTMAEEEADGGCGDLSPQEFSIATHFVKVKRSGTLTEVTTLWDLVGTEAVSGSLDSVLDSRPGFDRLPSINAFDKVSRYHMDGGAVSRT